MTDNDLQNKGSIKVEAEHTLIRWDQSLLNLRDGFSQKDCDTLYRCIHEIKNISKVLNAPNLLSLLNEIDGIILRVKDRRVLITVEMLEVMTEISKSLSEWLNLDEDVLSKLDISSETASFTERLEKSCVIRGFSKRLQSKEEKEPDQVKLDKLLSTGKITQDDLDKAFELQKRSLLEILVDESIITKKDLEDAS